MDKIKRNMDTEESREFWESAKKIAEQTKDWPDSRKAGINERATKEDPIFASPIEIFVDGVKVGEVENWSVDNREFVRVYDQDPYPQFYTKSIEINLDDCDFMISEDIRADYSNITDFSDIFKFWEIEFKRRIFQKAGWLWFTRKG